MITGKGQFLFQSQRKAMPKNVQTTAKLHSSHILAKQSSKFSKLGFKGTWTENFQMFKLDLKRQRNQRANCQHLLDHWKSKSVPEKHLLLLYWLCQSLWLYGSQQTGKILKEMGIPDHLTCLLRNLYAGQKQQLELDMEQQTVPNWERSVSRLYIVTLLI